MLSPTEELKVLGVGDAPPAVPLPPQARTDADVAAAYDRGYRQAVWDRGEVWAALFFGFGGLLAGWFLHELWLRYAG